MKLSNLDRLATLYFFAPLRSWRGSSDRQSIPILMYHNISDESEDDVHPYLRLNTRPGVFKQQLRWLKDQGYNTVSLPQALAHLIGSNQSPGKSVVITFDDGYQDFYTEAYPLLREFGFSATVFLPSAYIRNVRNTFMGRPALSWGEVRELYSAGTLFGSHTLTHRALDHMPHPEVIAELRDSKSQIEDKLGAPVTSFSYPFGFPLELKEFRSFYRNALFQTGYSEAVCTRLGTAKLPDCPFLIPRLPISSADDVRMFSAKLHGGYDWLRVPQYLYKRLRTRPRGRRRVVEALEIKKVETFEVRSSNPRYVIITPVRNEVAHFEETLRSVTHQTVLPQEWVIVDDGSTDGTERLADQYAARFPWITVVHRRDRGRREPGSGVVQSFYEGFDGLRFRNWDFIVKLDGDLSFSPDYFEKCLSEFAADSKLGIGGGLVYFLKNGQEKFESNPAYHVRGATKIYRRQCWEEIGGLARTTGWDTIDEFQARRAGWQTRSFPHLKTRQHKQTGSADGFWRDSVKNGQAAYISGYHPMFMLLKCTWRIAERPYFLRAFGLFFGFLTGYFGQVHRIQDREFIRYVRRQHVRSLFLASSKRNITKLKPAAMSSLQQEQN